VTGFVAQPLNAISVKPKVKPKIAVVVLFEESIVHHL
jgi:hypothetical protein